MAAGVATRMYGPLDWNGGETSELIQQWPHRPRQPGQPLEPEWYSSNAEIGRQVRCHATQSFEPVPKPAGTSKRITAFYSKTGVLEHRTEPQFKDFKGLQHNGLTEMNAEPLYARPTFQGTAPLILTRGARSKMGLTTSQSAPDLKTLRPSEVAALTGGPHEGSGRFHPAAPPSVRSSHSKASKASRQSQRTAGGMSSSEPPTTPTWFTKNPPPWNFDTLPTYKTSSRVIGLPHQVVGPHMEKEARAAGRSVSGFITPRTLIKNITK
eukprot:gnl/MRDRNA2_/MRDRNA2_89535_c0_seq1.p1 gnl/MRDRNA2_/MRDRNA2_89535_c0~~gnl/MRDRNA2_/MRDRNA2_89535_c0_seq1.p1  ORF type:complete len:267 (+),score=19.46 gnl/MRDRNA2_/MRDRNA2_89535_c0_seq1:132-932(+)